MAPPTGGEWESGQLGAALVDLKECLSKLSTRTRNHRVIACQQSRYSLVVSGPGKQVSLCHLAIELFEQGDVLFCFRSFRNDF
jgi:hypothetical protein